MEGIEFWRITWSHIFKSKNHFIASTPYRFCFSVSHGCCEKSSPQNAQTYMKWAFKHFIQCVLKTFMRLHISASKLTLNTSYKGQKRSLLHLYFNANFRSHILINAGRNTQLLFKSHHSLTSAVQFFNLFKGCIHMKLCMVLKMMFQMHSFRRYHWPKFYTLVNIASKKIHSWRNLC